MRSDTRTVLTGLLEGEAPTSSTVHDLRIGHDEGQWLDFKSGRLLSQPKAAGVLREYVAGFGNADGGVLVVGVGDQKDDAGHRSLEPCTRRGGDSLAEWAKAAIVELLQFFSPAPRFWEVDADGTGALILFVAVPRAAALVPIVSAGRLVYPIRVGASVFPMPEYMTADLILGKRRRPVLRLSTEPSIQAPIGPLEAELNKYRLGTACFRVENVSFLPAVRIRVGVVYWTVERPLASVPNTLRQYVDIRRQSELEALGLHLAHATFDMHGGGWNQTGAPRREPTVEPMLQSPPFPRNGGLRMAVPLRPSATWFAAVYLYAEECLPAWHQLSWGTEQALSIEALPAGFRPAVDWVDHAAEGSSASVLQ